MVLRLVLRFVLLGCGTGSGSFLLWHQPAGNLEEINDRGGEEQGNRRGDHIDKGNEEGGGHPSGLEQDAEIVAAPYLGFQQLLILDPGGVLHHQAHHGKIKNRNQCSACGSEDDLIAKPSNSKKLQHPEANQLDHGADAAADSHAGNLFFGSGL